MALNSEAVVLASASRTTNTTSTQQTNAAGRGVALLLDVTDEAGGAVSAITIQARVASGWANIYAFSALTVNAVNRYAFLVYPGAASAGSWTSAPLQGVLPKEWRVILTHSTADPITYELRAAYIV